MALDDFLESEVGMAVAATALLFSPRVRGLLRRGAVVGLASLIKVSDTISSTAGSIANEAQQESAPAGNGLQDIIDRTHSSG